MITKGNNKIKRRVKKRRNKTDNAEGISISKQMLTKNGLLKRLVSIFSVVILLSLSVLSAGNFFITKSVLIKDFKGLTNQILNQNKNYAQVIDESIEQISMQIAANEELIQYLAGIDSKSHGEITLAALNTNKELVKLVGINNTKIIENVYLHTFLGFSSSSDNNSFLHDQGDKWNSAKEEQWFKKALEAEGKGVWIPKHTSQVNEDEKYISYVKLLMNPNTLKPLGIIQINMDPYVLSKSIEEADIGKDGKINIIDNDGYIIAGENQVRAGQLFDTSYLKYILENDSGAGEFNEKGNRIYVIHSTLQKNGWKFIAEIPYKEIYSSAKSIGMISLILMGLCIIISVLVSVYNTVQITKPIYDIINITKQLASGDFNVSTKKYSLAEMNLLSENFNNMIEKLKDALLKTRTLAYETSDVSRNLLVLSQSLFEKSEDIVRSVEEISEGSNKQAEDTMNCAEVSNKLSGEINTTINLLEEVNSSKEEALKVLISSDKVINSLSEASYHNSNAMDKVAVTVENLEEKTKNILEITSKINDITNQTNLLALNASIEAARAGEAGKGFAVVANEIRELAEQSQEAAQDIKNIINGVKESIKESMNISEGAKETFAKELEEVGKTIKAFVSLTKSVEKVSSSVEKAMSSVYVMSEDKNQLVEVIGSIAAVSQENTAVTEEVNAVIQDEAEENKKIHELSESLNIKAEELQLIIDNFRFN
ncbi:methyl-accepting chemotaxis protein [Clostridium polynesiense]|uniref:methyl-accepting chemotaxis protein n=1 Tax=Clostridium polynesiense TaxID=1325933 RepID=UPI00058FE411|nr:methyl-accepting chemotaxis protein [Clostridium polynesiense]